MPTSLLTRCFLKILVFSCKLQLCVSGCAPAVKASRNDLYRPEGGSMSLSCDVVHCKQKWSGGWGIPEGNFIFLTSSPRFHLDNPTIDENTTRLFLSIYNLNQSDSGDYQCKIKWETSDSMSHMTHLNVTAAQSKVPEPARRNLSYKLLVCAAAGLCFPLALTLACCFSCKHQPAPPVPPPRSRISSTARVKPKADVVYAALTVEPPRLPSTTEMENTPVTTIYSTLNFATA